MEDALHATRAAVEEGVLPGGGTALLRSASALENMQLEGDQKVGAEILRRALDAPLRQLVANAGLEGSVVVDQIRHQNQPNYGFDVLREQYVDLLEAGIIDPAKVTRTALENAASVAGMILTTEALVTDVPEKETSVPAAPGGPDMYG